METSTPEEGERPNGSKAKPDLITHVAVGAMNTMGTHGGRLHGASEAVAISSDGKRIVSATSTGPGIRVWEAGRGDGAASCEVG
jgi:hypothetical protein